MNRLQTTLARHPGAGGDVLARLVLDVELDPLAPVGVDRARHQLVLGQVAQAVPLTRLEDHARRTHQLGHHDPLGAVDHERAPSVIIGKSPMNTVCYLISPVVLFWNSARTKIGAA